MAPLTKDGFEPPTVCHLVWSIHEMEKRLPNDMLLVVGVLFFFFLHLDHDFPTFFQFLKM